MRRLGYFAIGAFAGAMLSSVLALLLAPSSGSNLRNQLRSYTRQVVADVRNAAVQRREEMETQLIELRTPDRQS